MMGNLLLIFISCYTAYFTYRVFITLPSVDQKTLNVAKRMSIGGVVGAAVAVGSFWIHIGIQYNNPTLSEKIKEDFEEMAILSSIVFGIFGYAVGAVV